MEMKIVVFKNGSQGQGCLLKEKIVVFKNASQGQGCLFKKKKMFTKLRVAGRLKILRKSHADIMFLT